MLPMTTKTEIDFPLYKDFYRFSMFKNRFYKALPPFFFILSAIAIFYKIYEYATVSRTIGTLIVPFILIALCGFIAMMMTAPLNKYYKAVGKELEKPITFTFYDDHFNVDSVSEQVASASDITYDSLFKCYEVQKAFFLYVSNVQAYIVSKKDMNAEQLETLRGLLVDHIGKRFHQYAK